MMDANIMAALIVQGIQATNSDVDAEQAALLIVHWLPVCQAIIEHIQTAAVVTTTVSGGSSGGVHPGVIL